MTDVLEKLREGDIYRWRYREPGDDRAYGRYHCCSCIAIVRNGLLRDTFWNASSEGRTFSEDDLDRLDLTFIANMSDLETASEYQAAYYDDADIVNLNHSNSSRGNFYLRKGAKRSQKKMLEVATHMLICAQDDQRSASQRAERFREAIAKIESGEIGAVHL